MKEMSLLGKTKAGLARYATVLRGSDKEKEAAMSDDFEPVAVREKAEKQEDNVPGTVSLLYTSDAADEL